MSLNMDVFFLKLKAAMYRFSVASLKWLKASRFHTDLRAAATLFGLYSRQYLEHCETAG